MFPPSTTICFLKCPIKSDNKNQLLFNNSEAQLNYFNSLPKETIEKCTYQRADGVIRVPMNYDELINYNYVMYKNENFSDHWFFAFITNIEFYSENCCSVSIKTDVFQTWLFDFTVGRCFVEREHVSNDTIGLHTVPEGLELGEPIINAITSLAPSKIVTDAQNVRINREFLIVFQVTEMLDNVYFNQDFHQYNRVYSGLHLIAVTSEEDANKIIKGYASSSTTGTDAIVSIFLAPKELFQGAYSGSFAIPTGSGTTQVTLYAPKSSAYADILMDTSTIEINGTIDGYTPKNNKLFTHPFNFLYVTNNAGEDIEFRYEDFINHQPQFSMVGAIGQGCSIKLIPVSYKNIEEAYAYGLNASKLPVCAWATDYYTNWVTQNAVNIGVGVATSVLNGGVGIATGNYGAGLGAVEQIANTIAEVETQKRIPDQAHGNTGASDINFASRRFFSVMKMSVRHEYAEIIDGYFSMFGYKVNTLKVPNLRSRQNWNFVKTIEAIVTGDIPNSHLEEIKSFFDSGITLWHNPSTFLDYSQSNPIV